MYKILNPKNVFPPKSYNLATDLCWGEYTFVD